MEKFDPIQYGLEFSERLKNYEPPCYNPLAEFIPYVATKEIVHTKIISDLLSPDGKHHEGNIFLKEFLNLLDLNIEECHNISVIKERKVSRVLTEGGDRSIDIFISYKDKNEESHAIIIENKLNHAGFQPLQVEDYVEAISSENHEIDKIVLLHDLKQNSVGNSYSGGKFVCLYPDNLYDWIQRSTNNTEILAYGKYLKELTNKNIPQINAHKMINLELDDIKKLRKVVDAYQNLAQEIRNDIVNSVKTALPCLPIESTFGKLDEGWNGLQLWNTDSYKNNGVWVVVFPPKDPVDDEYGYDIYLYAKEDRIADLKEAANRCDYECLIPNQGYCFARKRNGMFLFHMFPQNNREELINEVVRLLTQLSKY